MTGYEELTHQQQDLRQAQLFSQLSLEDNINRLAAEKRLIAESQDELSTLTQSVLMRLEEASQQLEKQSDESHTNHQELLDDMMRIQNMAQIIFQRIEESSKILLEQSQTASQQYELTLKQLAEVNRTVHSLVGLIENTKSGLEERLMWITSALGGTDIAVERLSIVLWHTAFLLVSMVACAFLSARLSTRLIVATLPPLNLALSLAGNENAQDAVTLGLCIGIFIIRKYILI